VIGFLRLVGLFNAAIWFGAAVFCTFSVEPTAASQEMRDLLGPKSFPFFSVAISQLLADRYLRLFLLCSMVSLLHLLGEWLYLGRNPRKFWTTFLLTLLFGGVLQSYWIEPMLRNTHRIEYTRPQQGEAAKRSYRIWHRVSEGINIILLTGVGIYLWRVANPTDVTRFVGTPKFRS